MKAALLITSSEHAYLNDVAALPLNSQIEVEILKSLKLPETKYRFTIYVFYFHLKSVSSCETDHAKINL